MRVTGIISGAMKVPMAIHIYRITLPLHYIDQKTKHWASWFDAKTNAMNMSPESLEVALTSDIIVLSRPITDDFLMARKYCEMLHSRGAKIVYETDDDLSNVYRDTSNGEGASSIPYLPYVDALTVTTEFLKNRMLEFCDKPIHVINNYVEVRFFAGASMRHKREYNDTINVLLVGTKTHQGDWRFAAEAIKRLTLENQNVRMLVAGYHPDYVEQGFHVDLIGSKPYNQYPTTLAEADIVVCAIDPDDPFNHCKSAVKAMEAWAAKRVIGHTTGGAAVVATDSVVYNPVVRHMRNGLICKHSVDGYYDAIKKLVEDDRLRKQLQRRGLLDIINNHNMATGYTHWVNAYKKVLRS